MGYDVVVDRVASPALLDLKGTQDELCDCLCGLNTSFPETPNTAVRSGDLSLYWVGPDHWLLRAPVDREHELLQTFEVRWTPATVSIVVVSDTLAFFTIEGSEAHEIMSIASPLDTHPAVFPSSGVTFTEAFGLKALIIRTARGFELAVDRSFGDMVQDCLQRALSTPGADMPA